MPDNADITDERPSSDSLPASSSWMPFWRRPYFELKVLAFWGFLIWDRIGLARDVSGGVQDNNSTVTVAKSLGDDIDPRAEATDGSG